MNTIKLHLVPHQIQELADRAKKSEHAYQKDTYVLRLEAIRDFCNNVIAMITAKKEKADAKNLS
jgi:hypothetical protein